MMFPDDSEEVIYDMKRRQGQVDKFDKRCPKIPISFLAWQLKCPFEVYFLHLTCPVPRKDSKTMRWEEKHQEFMKELQASCSILFLH